jgi:hypothetical protein
MTRAGRCVAGAAILAIALVSASAAWPRSKATAKQQARSQYLSLSRSHEIHRRRTLLHSRLVLARSDSVLVESDGTFAPLEQNAAASVFIEIDGRRVTNESAIDWRQGTAAVRHTFEAVGASRLSSGAHRIKLVAKPIAGAFTVSKSSNLSIFVHPAKRVRAAKLEKTAGPFAFTTDGRGGGALPTPHDALRTIAMDTRGPTVALAAASTQTAAHKGDAMLGIYVDHRHPGNASSLWSVNDMCTCAEVQAPLFTQALLSKGRPRSRISLDATEFPWNAPGFPPQGEDPVSYLVRPSARLVVLRGGMRVVGRGDSIRRGIPRLRGSVWDWICVASSSRGGQSGYIGCPSVGSRVPLSSATFRVPTRHPGVVMFAAKSRVQGGRSDAGGTVKLWLEVDGVRRGSTGIQELSAPSSVSQRTISASYLAAGSHRLRPGRHTVEVYARIDGSFAHLALARDLPLVWFD